MGKSYCGTIDNRKKDKKQCDIHVVGKRYSFKERTPKIGDYISMFWTDGSDCECIFTGLDENITPLPDGWYYVD